MAGRKLVSVSSIAKFADSLARSLRANLQWSKQLRKAVRVSKVTDSGGMMTVTVSVGESATDKSGMPLSGMARAYEYGSGLHATRGIRQKYRISPRLKKLLSFSSTLGKDSGKMIAVPKVMHPGVNARPYLAKSKQAILKRSTAELALDIKTNLIGEMNLRIREINSK